MFNTTASWYRFAALIGGNIALAFGPWFVRLADTGPVAAGFWRLFLPLPIFFALAFMEGRRVGAVRPGGRTIAIVMAAGAFFALDLASWHIGIELTRLGNATLFGNAGSIILMAWGLIALRRGPSGGEWAAVIAALAGAAILMGRSLDISLATLAGDAFCLFAGLFYAFYLIPAQRARRTMGQWQVLALICLTGAPVLLLIALLLGEPVWPTNWWPVIGLAISSQIVGQGLLVFSMRHFEPLVIGLALLTQPAIAAVIGWLTFGEILLPVDVIGMFLLGASLVLARVKRRLPNVRPDVRETAGSAPPPR